jgi:hypothetical protein
VELDILDMTGGVGEDEEEGEDGEAPDKTAAEADFVADRIAALLEPRDDVPDGAGGQRGRWLPGTLQSCCGQSGKRGASMPGALGARDSGQPAGKRGLF